VRRTKAADGAPSPRVFDFRSVTQKGCAGNPVTFLKSLFGRVATEIPADEVVEVVLDLSRAKVSPNGASTVARSAGLAVARVQVRQRGVVSLLVKREV